MPVGNIIAILIIAIIHYYIFVIEVFFWNKPIGLKAFNLEKDFADKTKTMAINQGFYNAFLASGLIYSIIAGDINISIFFISCVFIAGIVGGITANKKIIYIQSLPAAVTFVLIFLRI